MTQYKNVTLDTIRDLRAKGFTHIRLELTDSGNPLLAVVEVIPGKDMGFDPDVIPLNSPEILDYFEEPSPMARYIIDQCYLQGDGKYKTI